MVDTNGVTQIADGVCPDVYQLYSMDWDINNTQSHGEFVYTAPAFDDHTIPQSFVVTSYVFISLFAVLFGFFAFWTFKNAKHPVVQLAQPRFLYTVLFGCLIGICTVVPLGIERHVSDQEAYELGTQGIEGIRDLHVDESCQSGRFSKRVNKLIFNVLHPPTLLSR